VNAPEVLTHEIASGLLPWLVNDSLDEGEKVAVLEHARACVICRRELGDLEQLRDSLSQAAAASPTPAPDMRNINARIDDLIDSRHWGRNLLSRIGEMFETPWRIAFAAQSILLIILASLLLWPDPENAEFTTLTQADKLPDGHYVRLVFSPDLAESELSALLDRFELEVVEGPSSRGVYTVGLAESLSFDDRDKLMMSLREDPGVLFAQPVGWESGR
jgi:hypothetical protein